MYWRVRGGYSVLYAMEGGVEGGMAEDDMGAIEDHSGVEERRKAGKQRLLYLSCVCFIDPIWFGLRGNPSPFPKMEGRDTDQSRGRRRKPAALMFAADDIQRQRRPRPRP